MLMNMAANMLGLGNAATPLGLRAMRDLEDINPRPGTATNAMCIFLAINTSSVQFIPTTAIAILTVKLLEKLPLFREPGAVVAGGVDPGGVQPNETLAPASALVATERQAAAGDGAAGVSAPRLQRGWSGRGQRPRLQRRASPAGVGGL